MAHGWSVENKKWLHTLDSFLCPHIKIFFRPFILPPAVLGYNYTKFSLKLFLTITPSSLRGMTLILILTTFFRIYVTTYDFIKFLRIIMKLSVRYPCAIWKVHYTGIKNGEEGTFHPTLKLLTRRNTSTNSIYTFFFNCVSRKVSSTKHEWVSTR